jgi:mono/diheme cytochrome c family protein
MKRILTWTVLVVLVLAGVGLGVFLYNIPPFFADSFREQALADIEKAPPPVDGISDPAIRAIATRGRDIVRRTGCIGCHAAAGPQGPDLSRYLAGGSVRFMSQRGTFVSRNLTPDPETGIGRRTDEEVKRVMQSGTFPDGHVVPYSSMVWANLSHWTEEDRHAVLVYLRNLPPVRNKIPDAVLEPGPIPPGTIEGFQAFKDYSIKQ